MFYSRRSDGPYYRWYATGPEQWSVARVHERDFSVTSLSMSRWNNVPAALQKSLINHYEE